MDFVILRGDPFTLQGMDVFNAHRTRHIWQSWPLHYRKPQALYFISFLFQLCNALYFRWNKSHNKWRKYGSWNSVAEERCVLEKDDTINLQVKNEYFELIESKWQKKHEIAIKINSHTIQHYYIKQYDWLVMNESNRLMFNFSSCHTTYSNNKLESAIYYKLTFFDGRNA